MDACASVLLVVLLRGAFSFFDAGCLLALQVLVFGSDGLHSSLSSSLLTVWEKDLIGEHGVFGIISNNYETLMQNAYFQWHK